MKGIKKFYERGVLELLMFGFVQSMRRHTPSGIDFCIMDFKKVFGLCDDYPLDSLRTTYYRLLNEWMEAEKSNG